MNVPDIAVYSIAGFSILFGLVECFYGFRIFKIMLGVIGFIIGGLLLGGAGMALSGSLLIGIVAGIIGGVVGAVLMVVLHFVGVFFIGAMLGAVLSTIVLALVGMVGFWPATLAVAILGGVLALYVRRPMIIISTALSGSYNVVGGVYAIALFASAGVEVEPELFTTQPQGVYVIVALVAWAILGIVGIVFQFRDQPDRVDRPRPKDRLRNTVLG